MNATKDKVILTGYRATGKSVIGKKLARRLDYDFLDMDREIERRQGRTIAAMVADQGWDSFRSLEHDLLEELTHRSRLVIATGGGAIMHRTPWRKLMATGFVIWLTADLATIRQRLTRDTKTAGQRPSLTGKDITAEIEAVLAERSPLYRQGSHLEIDTTGSTVSKVVTDIIAALARNNTEPLLQD